VESVFSAERVGRSVSKRRRIGTKLSLSILIVGVFGRGSITNRSVEAFPTECHSGGIELIILMRKNLCSGFTFEFMLCEKELFSL